MGFYRAEGSGNRIAIELAGERLENLMNTGFSVMRLYLPIHFSYGAGLFLKGKLIFGTAKFFGGYFQYRGENYLIHIMPKNN